MSQPLKRLFGRVISGKSILFQTFKRASVGVALVFSCAASGAALPYPVPSDGEPLTIRASKTDYSRYVEKLNDQFGNILPEQKILIIDSDWMALNHALNPGREEEVFAGYAMDRSGLNVPVSFAKEYVGMNMANRPFAESFRLSEKYEKVPLCIVNTYDHNRTKTDILQASVAMPPELYGTKFMGLPSGVSSREDIASVQDFHELGHCFDKFYLHRTEEPATQDQEVEYTYRAEIFADVMQSFLIAKYKGIENIGVFIADMAALYSAFDDWKISQETGPKNSFGLPASSDGPGAIIQDTLGGIVYMSASVVDEAQEYINRKGIAAIQAMSTEDLRKVAVEIVENKAMTLDELLTLYRAGSDSGYFRRLSENNDRSFEDNRHYEFLKGYYSRINLAAERMFGQKESVLSYMYNVDKRQGSRNVTASLSMGLPGRFRNYDILKFQEQARRQNVIRMSESLKRQIVNRGRDSYAVAEVFGEAARRLDTMISSPYPYYASRASDMRKTLPYALRYAVMELEKEESHLNRSRLAIK